MKVWTIQKRSVMEYVMEASIYQPDFQKSDYVKRNPSLEPLYDLLLTAFNNVNYTNVPGLIFGFHYSENDKLYDIAGIEDFLAMIYTKYSAIKSLWEYFVAGDYVIVELDIRQPFLNPLHIDLNDFQFLMPPIIEVLPYTKADVNRLVGNLERGKIGASSFPSDIIQSHLPSIRKSEVENIYDVMSYQVLQRIFNE